MESLDRILQRIEAPIEFASRDGFIHLLQIRNLGSTITSLLYKFKETIFEDKSRSRKGELEKLCDALLVHFEAYDTLTPEEKKHRFPSIISLISDLKKIMNRPKAKENPIDQGKEIDSRNDPFLLSRPVRFIHGVGPRIEALFAKKNICSIEDLLYYTPRRYEDRRSISRIAETIPSVLQTVIGRIMQVDVHNWGRKKVLEIHISDGSGILKAKWFKGNEIFIRNTFKREARVILTGNVTGFPFNREMIHPDFEILSDRDDQQLHFRRIVPIYSETDGLHQKTIRRILWSVVRDFSHLAQSPIPEDICRKRALMGIREAFSQIHFPENNQDINECLEGRTDAHRRLIYDDLFFFELGMALRRKEMRKKGIRFRIDRNILNRFYRMLPFHLTEAQQRVISDIERDMEGSHSMSRLLQGDVGSGKTVVAMVAIITACDNGYQAAIMAPTEILAAQHFRNLRIWSKEMGIDIERISGGMKPDEKRDILDRIENGKINLIVGTHALIQDKVVFRNLGLAVIDEQHRFGVLQRDALRRKGQSPDVLFMTATPIPRTLAMTVYGDLDISLIDEMPPGKIPIHTKVYSESQRMHVYDIIRREVIKGNQVFIVYPLVEASEKLDLKDATRMAEHLQKEVFAGYKIGLIHGRMPGEERKRVMKEFSEKRIPILVSTTVIEVGIDIPNASLMVIEHAERFGLSQLHQLRGRVGRNDIPAFCILIASGPQMIDSSKRLRIMEKTSDGFQIAEEDLSIRGPGEFMGTRQSGLLDFRIANIVRDVRILNDARTDAFGLIDEDPFLEKPQHQELKEVLLRRWGGRLALANIG